jgi:tetratricopeptide (TPR) repeat protein
LIFPHNTLDAESEYYWGLALHELHDLPAAHRHWAITHSDANLAPRVDLELASDEAAAGDWKGVLTAVSRADLWMRDMEKVGLLEVIALQKTGDLDKARSQIKQWQQVFPADLAFRYEAALLGVADGQPWLRWLHSTIDPDRILDIVDQYIRIQDYADALPLLGALDPRIPVKESLPESALPQRNPLILYYRGWCREQMRQPGQTATADYHAASVINADNVHTTHISSLDVLTAALKANPKDTTAAYLLGNLHLRLEMRLEAVEDWRRAVRGGLRNATVYHSLALTLGNLLHDRTGALAVLDEINTRGWMTPDLEALSRKLGVSPDLAVKTRLAALPTVPATAAAASAMTGAKPAKPKPDLSKLNSDELANQAFEYLGDNDIDSAWTTITLERLKSTAANEPLRKAYYEVQLQRALSSARKKECDAIPAQVATLAKSDRELAFTKEGGRDLFDTPRVLFYAGRLYGLCADAKTATGFWKQAARKTVTPESPQAVFVTFARIQLLALAGKPVKSELEAAYRQAEAAFKSAADGNRGVAEYQLAMMLQALGRLTESDSHFQAAAKESSIHYLALVGIRDNDLARRGVK